MNASEGSSPQLGVLRHNGAFCLVAAEPVSAGTCLFRIEGRETNIPSRYSVQIGMDLHLEVAEGQGLEEILDRHAWRFMNHSCDPNTLVRGREFTARRDIDRGEAVTFNYNTSEYDMARPFTCLCGASCCEGTIRGFRHLSQQARAHLRPWLSAHLLALLVESAPLTSQDAPA